MAKKQEERDWSEIVAEVRTKAASEANEAFEDIQKNVKKLVEKVRAANFHEEAEEFLSKVKKLAEDFSHSEDGPSKAKSKASSGNSSDRAPLYIEPNGTERFRKGKWAEGYTDAELEKMKQR